MRCKACEDGLHYLCGMQTWCECDCAGPDEAWGPSPDDDMPHADTCTCEHCAQLYPERLPESWEDDDTCDHEETEEQAEGTYCVRCGEYLGTPEDLGNES